MTADEVRKALGERTVALLRAEGPTPAAVRAAVDDLGCGIALAPEWERRELAARAVSLYPAFAAVRGTHDDDRFDVLASGDARRRAEAADRLDDAGAWTGPETVGSLTASPPPDGKAFDVGAFARAVAVAWREAKSPRVREAQTDLHELMTASVPHERDGMSRWDRAFGPIGQAFVGNGTAAGLPSDVARARALTARLVMRGRALQAASGRGASAAHLAGAAAVIETPAVPRHPKLVALLDRVRGLNDMRQDVRSGAADPDLPVRLAARVEEALARPAAASVGTVRRLDDGRFLLRRLGAVLRLPEDVVDRLAPLTLRAAVRRLEAMASDARTGARAASGLSAFAEALRQDGESCGRITPFARHVGLADGRARTGSLQEGMTLHEAAPIGRIPAWRVCIGERGRAVRCRAVADDEGRVVGYKAFDALSGEFHGQPTYALYGLDGRRAGHFFAGEDRARMGEPRHGFVTAPASVPVGHPALA